MSRAPEWNLELPEEWRTGPFDENHLEVLAEHPEAGAVVVSAMLYDGTNIMALLWDKGQRLARCSPEGVIDERFSGAVPAAYRAELTEVWRHTVAALVAAKNDAEREFGPAVVRTHRDRARWLLSNAPGAADGLRRAYEVLDRPDISFETFRQLVEVEAEWPATPLPSTQGPGSSK